MTCLRHWSEHDIKAAMAFDSRVGFWGLVWQSFVKTQGTVLGIFGTVITICAWKFLPGTAVSLWVVSLLGGASALIVLVLVEALRTATTLISFPTVQVVDVHAHHPPYPQCRCICVVEPREPLPNGTKVSFHLVEPSGYERPLGVGVVLDTQEDGRVKVTLNDIYRVPELEKIVSQLLEKNGDALKRLRVRTSVYIPDPVETKSESLGLDDASEAPPPTQKGR